MTKISKEEQASLKEAFKLYDTKHKGIISTKQLLNILKELNIVGSDDKKIQETIKKNDKKKTGNIDYDMFVNIMNELISSSPPSTPREEYNRQINGTNSRKTSKHELDELKKCFEKFDKNGDGQISEDELKQVMKDLGDNLTDKEIKDMMIEADTNKNGLIEFDEFKKLLPN